ncbi:MAG: BatD family protein [Alistipes onderdonkii]
MRDFIAKISLTALFVLAIFSASAAEKVTFEANSPLTVAVGEPFRVEFALNAQPEPGSFKAPSFEGFDVIAGPAEAQGQSIQIVNNSMTRVVNYTITYVLVPQGAGNVTVGAAEVTVEGLPTVPSRWRSRWWMRARRREAAVPPPAGSRSAARKPPPRVRRRAGSPRTTSCCGPSCRGLRFSKASRCA